MMQQQWPTQQQQQHQPDQHMHKPISALKDEDYNALLDDDDDDDLNIDTSNMTQEEKNDIKQQRKLRKMNREKLKRAKLNNQFDHLCQMLSMGRSTRVEKLAVLNEAIRNICKLQAENDGLRMQKQYIKHELERRRTGNGSMPPPSKAGFGHLPVKQEHVVNCAKQEIVSPKATPFGWRQEPDHNDNSDLDFAFGDSCDDFWEAEPEKGDPWQQKHLQQQKWPLQQNILDIKGFPSCAQPLDTDDCIDMFLETGETGDLLCF